MSMNDEIFIVVESISNVINAISELDNLVMEEKSELRINELKNRQRQLIEILKKLVEELNASTRFQAIRKT